MRKGVQMEVLLVALLLMRAETQIVSPEELVGRAKVDQRVKPVLKTGTYAENRLEEASPTHLKVKVRKSHDLRDLPTGMQELSFDRLASVTISTYKGNKRKWLPVILCSTLGALSLVVATGSAAEEAEPAYIPAEIAFTAGLAAAGYYGGQALDREQITFLIR